MAIQVRRGAYDNFDPTKMLPGEWAVAIDGDTSKQVVWMCFAPGVVKRMGTYEDFKQQIAEMESVINEHLDIIEKTIEDSEEIRQAAVTTEQNVVNATASEQNAKQSELLAQEYAEKAFAATPEGYDQLVEEVGVLGDEIDRVNNELGKNQCLAYDSYAEMIAELNNLPSYELERGQNIYIGTVSVPDLWVYSVEEQSATYTYVNDDTFVDDLIKNHTTQVGYYKLAQLETQKVDLEEYAKKEDVQGDISALDTRIIPLENLVNGDTPKIITVGSSGCRFTKINDAITFAKTYCSTSNRVTIFIAPGTYNEQIVLINNPGIDLIGCGHLNTIIQYDGAYPNCVINTTGPGLFKDLYIYNTNNTTYAVHSENGESGLKGNLIFENCFIYGGTHAVGVGLGQGENFFLNNCLLYSKSNAPIYFHNAAYENVTNQNMRVHNCRLYCTTSSVKYGVLIDDAAYSYGITTGVTYVEFINTHYRQGNQILFRRNTNDSSIDINYINVSNSRFRVTLNSSGNNMLGLNYDNREVNITQYVTKPTQSSSGTNYFEYSIFYPHADKYKWYVTGATLPGVGDITSNLSIQNTSENSINLKDTNTGGAGYAVSITLKGTVK